MTENQLRLLEFVREHIARRGFSPMLPEIAKEIGVSRQTVHKLVGQLTDEGHLKRTPWRRRGIELADPVDLRAASDEEIRNELARRGLKLPSQGEAKLPATRMAPPSEGSLQGL